MGPGRNFGRSRLRNRFPLWAVLTLLAAVGLGLIWWWQSLRPPSLQLQRVSFSDLPGWSQADTRAALSSFRRGCQAVATEPPAASLGYAGTAADWQGVCAQARNAQEGRGFFESRFTPYAIGGKALFTGYYEPEISGSRVRHGPFQTPVYGRPADLVNVDLGQFLPKLKGEHISGRLSGQSLVPYADRAEIDAKGLPTARILFWSDDPVAVFFLQIQGSGRVRFEDGGMERIAFAGTNGRPYTAIGRALIEKGVLTRTNVSLASIRAWLKRNPSLARGVMELDRSFVFFREAPLGDASLGSPGTLGVPLTPLASLAVDARIHPLGAPFYVATTGADPVTGLMIGDDTGGAIRGAARGDIFFGFGPKAEQRAGGLKAQGRLYVLLPNPVAARLGAGKSFPL